MKTILVKFYTYAKEEYLGASIALNFTYSETLDESGEWSVEVESQDFMENLDISNEVEIYSNNQLIIDARISDITYNFIDAGVVYKFTGRDRIDDLYYYSAASSANFGIENGLNIKYLGALAYLLDKANWRLGDISTLVDPEQTFVKDLTGEKTLLNQVIKLIQENPDTFSRYGGVNAGFYTLDVGDFYEDLHETVTNSDISNLENSGYFYLGEPEIQKKDEIIEGVYAQGGTYSGVIRTYNPLTTAEAFPTVQHPVTFGMNSYLENWFTYLQESDIDPQFPIVETDYGNNFLVLNTDLGDGGVIRSHPPITTSVGGCNGAWLPVGANGTAQHLGIAQPLRSPGGNISSFSLYREYGSLLSYSDPTTYMNVRWKILNSRQVTDGGKGWYGVYVPGTTVLDEGTFTPSVTGNRKETITLNTPIATTAGSIYFLCLELEGQETASKGYLFQGVFFPPKQGYATEDEGEPTFNYLDKPNIRRSCQPGFSTLGWAFILTQSNDPGNGDTDWQTISELTYPGTYGLRFEMVFDRTTPQYPRVFQDFPDYVPYYGYYEGISGNPDLAADQGWIFPLKSLYNQAIRFLKKNSQAYFSVSGKVYGDVISKVGAQMKVKGNWEIDKYDPITNKFVKIQQEVDESLRVMSKKIQVTALDTFTTLSLNSKTIDFSQNNNTIALYDALIQSKGSSENGTIHVDTYPPKLNKYTKAQSGFTGASSTTMSDGRVGVQVTFSTPTEAYQYNYASLAYEAINTNTRRERPNRCILAGLPYTSSGDPVDVEIVQWPDIGIPMIAKIAYKNRPWSASESDTFNYYLLRLS